MAFNPLHDNVVVLRDEITTVTAGGILLASGSLEKPKTGTVVSVGSAVTGIAAGDRILYSNRAGAEFKVDGETIFMLKEENIFGVLD